MLRLAQTFKKRRLIRAFELLTFMLSDLKHKSLVSFKLNGKIRFIRPNLKELINGILFFFLLRSICHANIFAFDEFYFVQVGFFGNYHHIWVVIVP